MSYQEVLNFWFEESDSSFWFQKNLEFDRMIIERFSETHEKVVSGECFAWRSSAQGRLAEILVIDQFSRNMFRAHPSSWAYDPLGLVLAQEAVSRGVDHSLSTREKAFLYMPYMHSESVLIHQEAVKLFSAKGLEENYRFELLHKKIIDRFGRYPHRNEVLGRVSTPEELEFLKEENSSF